MLKDPAVAADLRRRGERIAAAAGAGHEVESHTGKTRVRVTVKTVTRDARKREAEGRNLSSSLDAGR